MRANKQEDKKAFMLLNDIRQFPTKYARELNRYPSLKIKQSILQWKPTLAKVAEEKALDIAKRN